LFVAFEKKKCFFVFVFPLLPPPFLFLSFKEKKIISLLFSDVQKKKKSFASVILLLT